MTTHLKGRPCRQQPGDWDHATKNLSRVTCAACRGTKKYHRLREKAHASARELLERR